MAERPSGVTVQRNGEVSPWGSPLGRSLRSQIWDSSYHLPSLSAALEAVRRDLERHPAVGVLYVRLERWGEIQQLFSWREIEEAYRSLSDVVTDMLGKALRSVDIPADVGMHGEGFAVLLSGPRDEVLLVPGAVESVAERVALGVREHIGEALAPSLRDRITVQVGAGLISRPAAEETLEDCLVAALLDAEERAALQLRQHAELLGERLEEVIENNRLEVLYRPVVELASGEVAGFEAEFQGPNLLSLQHGDVMLDAARRSGLTYRLYDAYHETAFGHAAQTLGPNEFILLRAAWNELLESAVRVTSLLYGLQNQDLAPANVVFLLDASEVAAMFPAGLLAFRSVADMGFRLALDLRPDCPPALDHVRELEPDYLRIGGRIVRALTNQADEFELVLMLSRFARRRGMRLIASDCLDRAEILALKRAGADLVSGALLAPAAPEPQRQRIQLP